MPKLKTNRAAAKRFRTTKSGVIKRSKAYLSHILTTKTRKRKRRLRLSDTVNTADYKNISKLIPYKF
jgi:large subunit ribosomal protein L35